MAVLHGESSAVTLASCLLAMACSAALTSC
jgi:hypothetical protein